MEQDGGEQNRGRGRYGPGGARSGRGACGLDAPLGSDALPTSVRCPFCRSVETEQLAAFGGAVSTSQYWCRSCRSGFEYMKWRGA